MTFEKLGLKKEIIDVLSSLKFKEPLEVQTKIIPLTLKNKNVVFTSATGSGKTLAYSLGFLSRINKKQGVQMVVVTPTRELCIQVGKELDRICGPLFLNVGIIHGGRDIKGDYKTTSRKNHILVVTPGRFIQHVNDKNVFIGDTKFLVFDESDQMFDQGFYDDCVYIKKRVSKNVQIVLCSATITDKVQYFIESEIFDFELLSVGKQIPDNIVQNKIFCSIKDKNLVLLNYLKNKKFKQLIVFCNTKNRCDEVTEFLEKNHFKVKMLTGALDQTMRNNYLNLFKSAKFNILVTTDVVARGLHLDKVDFVVNYDVPTREEFYVHRIGRTGRTDKNGYALTLVCPEDEFRFQAIESTYDLDVKLLE